MELDAVREAHARGAARAADTDVRATVGIKILLAREIPAGRYLSALRGRPETVSAG